MEELTLSILIEKLKSEDPLVRRDAWLAAGPLGAQALRPLAELASDGELEVARAANRAMWQIVRYVGAPGRNDQRRAVVQTLVQIMKEGLWPVQLQRDIIWMLSEIIADDEIDHNGALQALLDYDLGEDARMALQRVGGPRAIAVLKAGYAVAYGDFKAAIACSLRKCGVAVEEPPCPKLVPRKQTKVKPVGREG